MTLDELIEETKLLDIERAAKQAKLTKTYVRKTLTLELKDALELQEMINCINNPVEFKADEETPERVFASEDEWDVPITLTIEYFDPELSYELTGYRPITATRGLDFNPKLFTEAADRYRANGRYTTYIPGTFLHRLYWLEEFNRCKNGLTVGKYRLTGENYFWLNYYRLESVISDNGEELRNEDFPGFLAAQYEYFHYLELCRKLKMDGLAFKSRAVGASEIAASNAAHAYTFHKKSWNIVTAFYEDYVKKTLSKVWILLNFLNTQTETAFAHLRMKYDLDMYKKASVVDKDGNESGWGSIIEGITHDKPRKLRGDRVYSIYFEEAGSDPVLEDTYTLSEALVLVGGKRVGNRFSFGTGGDAGPALAGLKKMFYNPEEYHILPYRNKYMRDGSVAFTGYFIPSFTMWFGLEMPDGSFKRGFDERGVVDLEAAKLYYLTQFSKKKDPHLLLTTKAEFCFNPEDAFVLEGSNAFNSEKLAELQLRIDHKLVDEPQTIKLQWSLDDEGRVDRKSNPLPVFGLGGHIKLLEQPITDNDGIPYKNLYVIGVDGIDTSADTTTGQTDLSKFCIVVYRRLLGLKDPKIVALYKHRPRLVSDAYDETIKLALYYNAKVLVEATRVGVIEHFKKYDLSSYLMRKPSSITTGKNSKQFGVPASAAAIDRQLLLINDYVENYSEQICYPEVIDELLRYSFENKRKFDIVAAFGIALLADEEMINKLPKAVNAKSNANLNRLGYYKNRYGLILFGVMPTKKEENYGDLNNYGRF